MTGKPSGRAVVDASGKRAPVMLDEGDPKSIEAAHGYDLKAGALYNAILALPQAQRAVVLAQNKSERRRIMALSAEARAAAIDAIADAAEKSKSVPPAKPAASASEARESAFAGKEARESAFAGKTAGENKTQGSKV